MSGGGAQALVGKWGRVPGGGGLTNFCQLGGPPKGKNPAPPHDYGFSNFCKGGIYKDQP